MDELRRLRALWKQSDYDLVEAVRLLTGATTSALADDLHLTRQSVEQCLRSSSGRRYDGVRRAVETHIGVPPYSLDALIDSDR